MRPRAKGRENGRSRRGGTGTTTPHREPKEDRELTLYDYLCARCGPFEVSRSLGTAAPHEICPDCGRPAGRTYGAPAVTSPRSAPNRAREAAERSAHEPRIVSDLPPRAARRLHSPNPLHAKLPRP